MKKQLFYFLTTCLCLLLSGACSSGGEDIPDPKPQTEADRISSNPSTLSAGAEKGSSTLTFTTNKAWTATSSQIWCTLSSAEGNAGTATLTIAYDANPDEKERTAVITIKAGTASATTTVKQAGASKNINGNGVESMPNDDWNY